MSANIASIANLKGGVGKSTTTVMLADGLAYFFGLDVLVVDLDSQANSSQVLLTEIGLDSAADQGKGAHEMLGQFVRGEPALAGSFIVPNAVSLEELRWAEERDERLGWVSVLPSHPKLRLAEMALEEDWYSGPGTPSTLSSALTTHFRQSIEPLLSVYDVILIDCPPHLSPLSRAALAVSDTFILPTLADPISTWGTKQFSDWVGENITGDLAAQTFIVVTRFRNTAMARQIRSDIQDIYMKDRYFGAVIPDSVSVLKAMDRPSLESYNTFRGKYGSVTGDVRRLAQRYADFMIIRTGVAWRMVRE
ncbi:MAG: ParA family protein [Pseudomonadota bacterium]